MEVSLLSSSTILKLLLLVVMLVLCLVQTLRPRRKRTPLPPGLVPWPVVGNLPELILNKPAFRWIHHVMMQMGTDIACFKLGRVHVMSIACPEIAREVLKKQDANFVSRPLTFASKTISGGYKDAVLSPYGDQWKKMRHVFTSVITCPSRHKWLHDKRADEADNLTRYVYNLATSTRSINVRHVARHYCGNVIRRLIFNKRYFGEPRSDSGPGPLEVQHVDALLTSLGLLYAFCVSDYLPWLIGLDLDGHEKMVREANDTVNRLHDTIIDERWRQWKSGERQEQEDFLDVLISLKDAKGSPRLTIDEVKALAKVRARIGLGRNPRVWNDPLRFNPDRHISADPKAEVALTENDLRFISFSTGRRGCIAASLGTSMSVMLFGRLLQGFTWTKPAGMAAVDLSESKHDTFMAKPLVLRAQPRLGRWQESAPAAGSARSSSPRNDAHNAEQPSIWPRATVRLPSPREATGAPSALHTEFSHSGLLVQAVTNGAERVET
ncbi:hypothetical protein EJB05_03488, partial [Eragrostis curvula]